MPSVKNKINNFSTKIQFEQIISEKSKYENLDYQKFKNGSS
jgi:hypothetical protein